MKFHKLLFCSLPVLFSGEGYGSGHGVGADAGGLEGGSRVGFAGEDSAKLTAAHDALKALGTAAEGFVKGVAEESSSNLVKSRTGTANGGGSAGSAGSLKGGAEELISPRVIDDRFINPASFHGAAALTPNGSGKATAAKPLESSGGVDVFDATVNAASDVASTQLVSKKRKGRKLIPIAGCKDDPTFEFFRKKRSGRLVSKGGCKFVGRKKKRRCRKVIGGVRVRKSCPRTCSRCTPTSLLVGVSAPENTRIPSAFNSKVFDSTAVDQRESIAKISRKCADFFQDANNSTSFSEILGCKLWFQMSDRNHKFAMGPLKVGQDLLNSNSKSGYAFSNDYKTYTDIFTPNALAIMISEGCFEFEQKKEGNNEHYSYASRSELKREWSNSQSTSINVDIGFGPLSVSMGSENSRTETSQVSSTSQYFHAKRRYFSYIGGVTNLCFGDSERGNNGGVSQNLNSMKMIVDNNLVKRKYWEAWLAIRELFGGMSEDETNSEEYLEYIVFRNPHFKLVAESGFHIPDVYDYGIEVNFYVTGSYVQTSSSQSENISNTIRAGFSVATPEDFTVGSSLSNSVENSMNEKLENSELILNVEEENRGDISTACLDKNTCKDDVEEAAEKVRNDVGLLGVPLRARSYLSMDSFVFNWLDARYYIPNDPDHYRRSPGFPSGFRHAVEIYYSYEKCARSTVPGRVYVGTYFANGTIKTGSIKQVFGRCNTRRRFLYLNNGTEPMIYSGSVYDSYTLNQTYGDYLLNFGGVYD